MFQSLLGRLKTGPEAMRDDIDARFQSLLGRLKTRIFFSTWPMLLHGFNPC